MTEIEILQYLDRKILPLSFNTTYSRYILGGDDVTSRVLDMITKRLIRVDRKTHQFDRITHTGKRMLARWRAAESKKDAAEAVVRKHAHDLRYAVFSFVLNGSNDPGEIEELICIGANACKHGVPGGMFRESIRLGLEDVYRAKCAAIQATRRTT